MPRTSALLLALFVGGCSSSGHLPDHAGGSAKAAPSASALLPAPRPASPPASAASARAEALPAGNVEHGRQLAVEFECNRCHDGTGHPAMAAEKHCVHCHEDITRGRFGNGSPKLAGWRASVAPYRWAPSLEGAGKRLGRDWVAAYLMEPYDLRPHLAATMPRLALSPAQAADLAAYVTRDAPPGNPAVAATPGDGAAGRTVVEQKGCGGCHAFTGAPLLPTQPDPSAKADRQKQGVALAPDLRHTRDRFRRDALVRWLIAPSTLKHDTVMPSHSLSEKEAADIAAYLTTAPLTSSPPAVLPARLPLLERAVKYAEVEKRVLSVTCRHCHTDPDSAGGDGGPGNTGGFGFKPRGLDLSSYAGALSGYLGHDGDRTSIFAKTADGTPFLVASLVARRSEEAGKPVPGVRGMPLGLPSLPLEDVQLVESWIAQGRPR